MAAFDIKYFQVLAGSVAGLVLAIVGVGSPIGNQFVRPDPFTSQDGEQLEARCKAYAEMLLRQHTYVIPPGPTRRRIHALERWVEKQDHDYSPPTQEWR